jgi:hypothetical protein
LAGMPPTMVTGFAVAPFCTDTAYPCLAAHARHGTVQPMDKTSSPLDAPGGCVGAQTRQSSSISHTSFPAVADMRNHAFPSLLPAARQGCAHPHPRIRVLCESCRTYHGQPVPRPHTQQYAAANSAGMATFAIGDDKILVQTISAPFGVW